ncbi:hypothetical protein HDR66_01970 [bacterium]|nr:hypothetical protein [bacterium]
MWHVVWLVANGGDVKMMLYHKIIPYVIMGSASVMASNDTGARDALPTANNDQIKIEIPSALSERISKNINVANGRLVMPARLARRATETRRRFVDNILSAHKRLATNIGRYGYVTAIRNELPGAPVGSHCMFGQYTQLMRALEQGGDTLTVIPIGGERECTSFKAKMREKYATPEYDHAIREGRVFESSAEYDAALEKYLARHGLANDSTTSARRQKAIAEFAKHNFAATDVNPGSIWIVPRYRGSHGNFHAIMFLGAGRVENGEFIADPDGPMMYAAHNRECVGELFKTWDTSNVFCADIEKILIAEYEKELRKLESMPHDEMVKYIVDGTNIAPESLHFAPRSQLIRMVHDKYFGRGQEAKIQNVITAQNVIAYKSKEVTR